MRRSIGLVGVVLAVAMGAGLAAAQTSQVIDGTGLPVMPSNAVRDGVTPWNFGVLAQGGVGVTEDRGELSVFYGWGAGGEGADGYGGKWLAAGEL